MLLSAKLALVTTVALLVIATPIAYLLAFHSFRGRSLMEALFSLPIVLPPTVLGFFMLLAIGNLSPIGRVYADIFGGPLAFSFAGIVVASVLYSFPFALQPVQNAFQSINPRLMDAARTLGCTKREVFWRVLIPGARGGIITAGVLSFAHTVGEFGVVLMVGGSIPGETRVASIAIYDSVEVLDYGRAAATSAVMLVFSFAVMAAIYYYNRSINRAVLG
jgi:molybdate transport system permease protein